ncbi:Nucleolar protein 56 [Tritrichomonas foetus]|uniref:Nucleolar protein 56 n=1 Tax=Tritrichomonas foetus TaxID=1144522 RepID=A0A1J4K9R9_9EUKA|nr:Nucleolar protein 56 [Tritrichomonas foetus]|eukprot:OHT06444.1 Nucleolar protein 56 [Tritrichomonas foetus]
MSKFLILYEHAAGLALFEVTGINEVGLMTQSVQETLSKFDQFNKKAKLIAFQPFPSTDVALETMNLFTEGQPSDFMIDFLATSLPEAVSKHKSEMSLGISEPKLAGAIQQRIGVNCVSDDIVREILRGCRQHFYRFMEKLNITAEDLDLAILGLSHSYSRAKVKFNQHGDDNMIISAIALLTGLDKDVNTFSMRLREWYSFHFPELSRLVEDHKKYAQCVQHIGRRSAIDPNSLNLILDDSDLSSKIAEAAPNSIGREIEDTDLTRIISMAARVEALASYRNELAEYLHRRMHSICPNLTSLIGDRMGAQLIMASGSLTNLAKAPSSTVQLLGSEKALFNAMKKHKDTPKYGMIFNSGPVSSAHTKDKGRVARSLANKLSIAARVDAFSDEFRSGHLGQLMRELMDEKVKCIGTNTTQMANLEAMDKIVLETRHYEQNEGAEEALNPDGMKHYNTPSTTSTTSVVSKTEENQTEENQTETPRRRRKKHHHHHTTEEQTAAPAEPEQVPEPEPVPEVVEEPAAEQTPKRRRKHRKTTEA